MLAELDDPKDKANLQSTSDFANPPAVRAGHIFSKRSLSPKNSRTVSPLEKAAIKSKMGGTSPLSRPQLNSLPDGYSTGGGAAGYRMTPVGRGGA